MAKIQPPQADFRAALPNIIKGYAHWALALLAGYFLAQDFVLSNGGTWPSVSFIEMTWNMLDKYGVWAGGGAGVLALYETYRPRSK